MSFKTLSQSVLGLCNRVLGEEVAYTPSGGSASTISAIFDNAWVDIDGVPLLKPVLRIVLEDLDELPGKGDTVEIESIDYKVMESRLDGYGGSTLILQKV